MRPRKRLRNTAQPQKEGRPGTATLRGLCQVESDRKTNTICSHLYVESNEQSNQYRGQTDGCQGQVRGGGRG